MSALALTIASPDGRGLITQLDGSRLGALAYSTTVNFGFKSLDFELLARDGSPYVPEPEAAEMQARWRFGRCTLYVDGQRAWVGRVQRINPHAAIDDPTYGQLVKVTIGAEGFYARYQDLIAALPDRDDDEDDPPEMAADELISLATGAIGGYVAPISDHLVSPGVSVPLQDSNSTTWYDHIIATVKVGTSTGQQLSFFVWEPELGPYLEVLGAAPPTLRLSVIGQELEFPWDGSEYVNVGTAQFSSQDVDQSTDLLTIPRGAELNNGLSRERSIQLDKVGKDGGDAGLLTFLNAHIDPRAPRGRVASGSRRLLPLGNRVRSYEGGEREGWGIRAGETIALYDLMPSDPYLTAADRVRTIVGTTYYANEERLEVELDDRPIRSRRNEIPSHTSYERGLVEPGAKGNSIVAMRSKEPDSQNIDGVTQVLIIGGDGDIEFDVSRAGTYEVRFGATMRPRNSSNTGRLACGYSLDEEGWNPGVKARTARTRVDAISTGERSLDKTSPRYLTRGRHVVRLWADEGVGGATIAGVHFGLRF